MNLTLRQLRAFVAVADHGSFTEAARRLHLTQAAMSVLVRDLESELGARVLDRHTRRVELSEVGRELYPYVQRMLRELDDAVHSVSDLRDKKKGFVRIAAPQMMACTLMPRAIARYHAQFPEVEMILHDTLPEHLAERVHSGDVELAVGPDGAGSMELDRRTLLRDQHFFVCPPDHPLAAQREVRWRELSGLPFIAPTRDFVRRIESELQAAGLDGMAKPAHEVSYMTTAIGMVSAGLGVTACPSYSAPLVKGYGLVMRPLVEPAFFRDVCIYHAHARSLSPAAQSFVDFLFDFVRNEPRAWSV